MNALFAARGRAAHGLRHVSIPKILLQVLPCESTCFLRPEVLAALPATRRLLSTPVLRRSQEAQRSRPTNVHNAETRSSELGRSLENLEATPIIIEFGKNGQWHKARDKFRSIANPDTILYNVVLTAADRCGRYEEGLELFAEMRKAGVQHTGVTYAGALALLSRLGRLAEARALWDELREARVTPTPACLNSLLNAAASLGEIREVEEQLARAWADGMQLFVTHLNCLVRAARELRQPDRAYTALCSMQEYGLEPDVVSYTLVMGACARALNYGTMSVEASQSFMMKLKEEMEAKGIVANAFFLEEELSVLLGIWPLSSVRNGALDGRSPEDPSLQAATAALAAATQAGTRRTKLVEAVEERVRALKTTPLKPVSFALPIGWCQTIDPTSGRPYYWQQSNPAGSTTWERPS